jgi:hypothetical protein
LISDTVNISHLSLAGLNGLHNDCSLFFDVLRIASRTQPVLGKRSGLGLLN